MTPFEKIASLIREGSGDAIEIWKAEQIAEQIIKAIRIPTTYMIIKLGDEPSSISQIWPRLLDTLDDDNDFNHLEHD